MVPVTLGLESFPVGCSCSFKPTCTKLFFFFPFIFSTLFPQSTPVESPDINFISISAEECDAEVTVTAPCGAGSRRARGGPRTCPAPCACGGGSWVARTMFPQGWDGEGNASWGWMG